MQEWPAATAAAVVRDQTTSARVLCRVWKSLGYLPRVCGQIHSTTILEHLPFLEV